MRSVEVPRLEIPSVTVNEPGESVKEAISTVLTEEIPVLVTADWPPNSVVLKGSSSVEILSNVCKLLGCSDRVKNMDCRVL